MDYNSIEGKSRSVNGQPCPRCPVVSIIVSRANERAMRKILKPFSKCVNALTDAVTVTTKETCNLCILPDQHLQPPPYAISHDQLSSPAIAIILLLPESGPHGASVAKSNFSKFPWQLHHTIQIQDKLSLNVKGSQEFYFISRNFPLWSINQISGLSSCLRIHLFVKRYNAMVEFYRLLTNSEMESQKPGFCVFPLNSDTYQINGCTQSSHSRHEYTSCELALKQCSHIDPYPVPEATLTFPVHNFQSLRTLLHSHIEPLSPRHYLVRDPDGNAVVLLDTNPIASPDSITPSSRTMLVHSSNGFPDKISAHSESIDSGHVSDFDFV